MEFEDIIKMQEKIAKLYEPQRKMIESIQSITNMHDNTFFQAYDLRKNIGGLNVLGNIMKIDTRIVDMVSDLQNIIGNVNSYSQVVDTTNISSKYTEICQSININVDIIRDAIGLANISDYHGLITGLTTFDEKISSIIEQIYQKSSETGHIEDEQETDFISNEEFQEAMQEQIENPQGFQERVSNWTEAKIKKYFIAYIIISFIWSNFLQPYFTEYIGMPVTSWAVSNIKEIPEKTGEIIGELKDGMEAFIIENIPYYYKVKFVDKNGETKEGYVSKRSVKIIDESVKTTKNNADTN